MLAEEWITLAAEWLRDKPGNAGKLLFYLMGKCLEGKGSSVSACDRVLTEQLHMSRDALTAAKRCVAQLVTVEAPDRLRTTYKLPAHWFDVQPSLFSGESVLVNRTACPENQDNSCPENQDSLAWKTGQFVLKTRTGVLKTGADVAGNSGHTGLKTGTGVLDSRTGATQNQQDADALSRSKSISEVRKDSRDYVLSILSMRVLTPEKRAEATVLAPELQNTLHQLGNVSISQNLPDDVVLAQCLAIAPLRELLPALKLAKQRRGRPKGYAWFVTVFLENIQGIPREVTLQVRDELRAMRQRKQPQRAEPLPFPAEITSQLAQGVRKMS